MAALGISIKPPSDSSRIAGKQEVILGRHLFAGESEFHQKIQASRLKHRIADRPNPDKSAYRNLAFFGPGGLIPIVLIGTPPLGVVAGGPAPAARVESRLDGTRRGDRQPQHCRRGIEMEGRKDE